MTTAISSDSLPLAREIADLREQRAVASGQAARSLVQDLKWAGIDRARELAADPEAHARAVELAHAGDQDAAEALRLATRLKPLPPPSPVRLNTGSVFSGAPVPGGLLTRLVAARRRGEPFDTAWGEALAALGVSCGLWLEILRATRPAWQAAYLGEPAPRGFNVVAWDDDE